MIPVKIVLSERRRFNIQNLCKISDVRGVSGTILLVVYNFYHENIIDNVEKLKDEPILKSGIPKTVNIQNRKNEIVNSFIRLLF